MGHDSKTERDGVSRDRTNFYQEIMCDPCSKFIDLHGFPIRSGMTMQGYRIPFVSFAVFIRVLVSCTFIRVLVSWTDHNHKLPPRFLWSICKYFQEFFCCAHKRVFKHFCNFFCHHNFSIWSKFLQ